MAKLAASGFTTRSASVINPFTNVVRYGGCYDMEEINAYFAGDINFTVTVDADGTVSNDGLPDILDEYKRIKTDLI